MVFPQPHDCKHRVSSDALGLICSLLRSKEHRLCSKKYRKNDDLQPISADGKPKKRLKWSSIDGNSTQFVYSDDAADIRRHPFFDCIAWDRHHLSRPPFVPAVDAADDTKYFDDESSFSTVGDQSICSSSTKPDEGDALSLLTLDASLAIRTCRFFDKDEGMTTQGRAAIPAPLANQRFDLQARKQIRRPRDKVLRDNSWGRQALCVRSKGVFIGYTYRRPPVALGIDSNSMLCQPDSQGQKEHVSQEKGFHSAF